jgi:hypothetical protein
VGRQISGRQSLLTETQRNSMKIKDKILRALENDEVKYLLAYAVALSVIVGWLMAQ